MTVTLTPLTGNVTFEVQTSSCNFTQQHGDEAGNNGS